MSDNKQPTPHREVRIGDIVKDKTTGEIGVVVSVRAKKNSTAENFCAVMFEKAEKSCYVKESELSLLFVHTPHGREQPITIYGIELDDD